MLDFAQLREHLTKRQKEKRNERNERRKQTIENKVKSHEFFRPVSFMFSFDLQLGGVSSTGGSSSDQEHVNNIKEERV